MDYTAYNRLYWLLVRTQQGVAEFIDFNGNNVSDELRRSLEGLRELVVQVRIQQGFTQTHYGERRREELRRRRETRQNNIVDNNEILIPPALVREVTGHIADFPTLTREDTHVVDLTN